MCWAWCWAACPSTWVDHSIRQPMCSNSPKLAEGNFSHGGCDGRRNGPPIAIALCTTFFKRITAKDRQSGIVNYVMGLSFITEGAIPCHRIRCASFHPVSSVPRWQAAFHGIWLYIARTYGDIFVLPTIGNPFMYLAAVGRGGSGLHHPWVP